MGSLLVVTHEEEAKKHTAVDCDTDRAPANMGRKRRRSSYYYSSMYVYYHTQEDEPKNTPRVDCDTEPTTSYLQQRELGLLIFVEEPRLCGHAAVKTLLYENQQP